MPRRSSSSKHRQSVRAAVRLDRMVWMLMVAVGSFYSGLLMGMQSSHHEQQQQQYSQQDFDRVVRQKVQAVLKQRRDIEQQQQHNNFDYSQQRFGSATARFALGASRVAKQDFVETFDSGFPPQQGNLDPAAQEVLILYNQPKALPSIHTEQTTSSESIPPRLTAMDATLHCQSLNVVSTKSALPQCLAILPQDESFYVQRWMRIASPDGGEISDELPLVPVGRGQQPKKKNGVVVNQFQAPTEQAIQLHWQQLQRYLASRKSALEKLQPMVQNVARDNAIVVMVCNRGHVDLLRNFCCSNRARGISVRHIVVFCTDKETYEIATTQLGLSAFYDAELFGSIPLEEAKDYGDHVFQQVMYTKVVAVQLVNWLGLDVLFQDVDLVWFQDALDVMQELYSDFDVLLQDDGARSVRFAPYQANSGFYFIRHNAKTRQLLTHMLYQGDMILTTGSHQQALNVLLAEFASLYNLRVKTLDARDFAGGYHYHRDHEYMRRMMRGEIVPYVFHMSWTSNKTNKIKFLQQMGMWYVQEDGVCSTEPIVTCHFRDKPSLRPCPDSPAMDPKGSHFWDNNQ